MELAFPKLRELSKVSLEVIDPSLLSEPESNNTQPLATHL
jgi:hypothetical protein